LKYKEIDLDNEGSEEIELEEAFQATLAESVNKLG